MKLVEKLRALVDPRGPLGTVVSPSDVYKERLGLPVTSPYTQRVEMVAPGHIEHTLAPTKFVAIEDAIDVPKDRVRQVSAFISEHWAPVYEKTTSTDMSAILRASENQIGWTVTQQESQQSRLARKHRQNAEEFIEVLQSCQIQASDEFYNGILETVPGSDPIILEGEILRGEATYDSEGRMTHDGIVRGTMITKGRTEYNTRTKGFAHVDRGFMIERERAQAEMDSRPVKNVRRAMEAVKGECLPMWSPVGINFRKDRRSAV